MQKGAPDVLRCSITKTQGHLREKRAPACNWETLLGPVPVSPAHGGPGGRQCLRPQGPISARMRDAPPLTRRPPADSYRSVQPSLPGSRRPRGPVQPPPQARPRPAGTCFQTGGREPGRGPRDGKGQRAVRGAQPSRGTLPCGFRAPHLPWAWPDAPGVQPAGRRNVPCVQRRARRGPSREPRASAGPLW